MDKACSYCGSPIPVPARRATVPTSRKYCGRACYDATRQPAPLADRFWKYVVKGDGCWEWQAARNRSGYGAFGLTREHMMPAHRFSWELHFGPIPNGFFVCHHCDNPPCVRPDHLFVGTVYANNLDMLRKGRNRARGLPGESNHQSKLTEADVRAIRALRAAGIKTGVIAKQFGISGPLVSYIAHRKAWKHVA